VPTAAIEDRTQVLPALRAVKFAAELTLIERAVAATAEGYGAAMRSLRPAPMRATSPKP